MLRAALLVGLAVLILVAVILLSTFFGGVAGVIVGWGFPVVPDTLRELFGVTLTNFQIGATLGFFGSFFKTASNRN